MWDPGGSGVLGGGPDGAVALGISHLLWCNTNGESGAPAAQHPPPPAPGQLVNGCIRRGSSTGTGCGTGGVGAESTQETWTQMGRALQRSWCTAEPTERRGRDGVDVMAGALRDHLPDARWHVRVFCSGILQRHRTGPSQPGRGCSLAHNHGANPGPDPSISPKHAAGAQRPALDHCSPQGSQHLGGGLGSQAWGARGEELY